MTTLTYHGSPAILVGYHIKRSTQGQCFYPTILPMCRKVCCKGKGEKSIRGDILVIVAS